MNRTELEASAAAFEQVLESAPDFANGWFSLAEIRRQLGQTEAAIAAYRKVKELDPGDAFGATARLMHLGAEPGGGLPEAYVRGVFDLYAGRFDSELTDGLAYRAPELLRAAVDAVSTARFDSLLDLGCGTGLAGAAFRDCTAHLTGIDLSPGMIAAARQKGIYDRLEVADLVPFLRAEIAAARTYSLIVAADVFVYLSDLTEVCAAADDAMVDGSLLAFTVEQNSGDGVMLGETLRFAHGAAHVRTALAGLTILDMTEVSTRNEAGAPVPGFLVVARKDRPGIAQTRGRRSNR